MAGKGARGKREVRGYLIDRREFNEIRMRLPRTVRRAVQAAPEGHVGLIAQATVEAGGVAISTLYATAPISLGAQRLNELEQRLARELE